jgi:hypothetical protein
MVASHNRISITAPLCEVHRVCVCVCLCCDACAGGGGVARGPVNVSSVLDGCDRVMGTLTHALQLQNKTAVESRSSSSSLSAEIILPHAAAAVLAPLNLKP